MEIFIFFWNTSLMYYWSRLNAHNVFECNIKVLNGHTTRYKSNWSSISCCVHGSPVLWGNHVDSYLPNDLQIWWMYVEVPNACLVHFSFSSVLSLSLVIYQYLSIVPLFLVHISRIIWELCRWPWSARGSWVEPDALEPEHKLVSPTNKLLELVSSFNQLS